MRSDSRAVAVWLALAGAGFLAAFVAMWHRFSAATPRWDLIACLFVVAIGVTGCLVTVRRRKFSDFNEFGTRLWWPDLRALWEGLFPLSWFLLLTYLVGAFINISPGALQMVEDGHEIAPAKVDDVLSSERKGRDRVSRYYTVKVRTSVPYPDGEKLRTVGFDSEYPVKPGASVWALYAPSSPQLGVFVEEDRADLEQKAGGPASSFRSPALMLLAALLAGALAYTTPGLPRHVRRALREGRVRQLPVRSAVGTATLAESPSAKDYNKTGPNDKPELKPHPCLLQRGPAGERIETAIGKGIDPVGVAEVLEGRQKCSPMMLYWIASGDDAGKGVLVTGSY